jgi:alpha-L-glutamate ligase-like protein
MGWSTLLDRLDGLAASRRELVGINRRNVELVYRYNPRRHYPLANDKILAKEILGAARVAVPATLAVCETMRDVAAVVDGLSGEADFVVKPANGAGGSGILVAGERAGRASAPAWRRAGGTELSPAQLHRHLADIVFGAYSQDSQDRALVERRVRPHATFHGLWADGLCDIRVLTLRARPLMAMVRVPTAGSGGRANLHQGGLGLAVDLASGRTFAALCGRRPVERHPDSGATLLGIELPAWASVIEVARRAAASVPLGYLGVDVVVDEAARPLVLEINARPGIEIQNVNGRGLQPSLEDLAS